MRNHRDIKVRLRQKYPCQIRKCILEAGIGFHLPLEMGLISIILQLVILNVHVVGLMHQLGLMRLMRQLGLMRLMHQLGLMHLIGQILFFSSKKVLQSPKHLNDKNSLKN